MDLLLPGGFCLSFLDIWFARSDGLPIHAVISRDDGATSSIERASNEWILILRDSQAVNAG